MNKIKIDREVKDNFLELSTSSSIDIKENINLFIYISKDINIDFNITSTCNINIFSISSCNINLNLNKEGITINYFYSSINSKKAKVKENIYHNKNNIKSNIKNHGLCLNKDLIFDINTYVGKNIKDSVCNQDSIIITDNNKSCKIKPNMIIDNNEIDANHSSYIGRFKDEEMFYLNSRGIDSINSKKILSKAFLVNDTMEYDEKDFIYKKLNENWR